MGHSLPAVFWLCGRHAPWWSRWTIRCWEVQVSAVYCVPLKLEERLEVSSVGVAAVIQVWDLETCKCAGTLLRAGKPVAHLELAAGRLYAAAVSISNPKPAASSFRLNQHSSWAMHDADDKQHYCKALHIRNAEGAPGVCVGAAVPGAGGVCGGVARVRRHLLPVRRPAGRLPDSLI